MVHSRLTVRPKQPTALEGENSVKLPGFELWMNYIENVLVVPTRLDGLRVADALADALKLYPHAAGHLLRRGDEWEIALVNAAVPVETVEVQETSVGIDDDWVLQPNLSRFFATKERGPVHTSELSSRSEEARLLLFRITLATNETAIGVSWHHTLGDATVLERFMRCMSDLYQGNDVSRLPTPGFLKRSFSVPTASLIERYSPFMDHLTNTCPTFELGQRYASMNQDTSPVSFRVSREQLKRLKARVVEAVGYTCTALSTQDILTAYIVRTLNRYLDTPITIITNAASYRNVPTIVHSPDVAGNAIYIIPTTLTTAPSNLSDVAVSIRQSILRYRDPTFVDEYMAVASTLMLSAVNSDRSWFFTAPPGKMSVNSNTSIDWRSAHFGYSRSTRFYTSGINDRYVRVFRSNPAREVNEQSEGNPGIGAEAGESLDVFFAVSKDIKDHVSERIESELRAPSFPYNIEI